MPSKDDICVPTSLDATASRFIVISIRSVPTSDDLLLVSATDRKFSTTPSFGALLPPAAANASFPWQKPHNSATVERDNVDAARLWLLVIRRLFGMAVDR